VTLKTGIMMLKIQLCITVNYIFKHITLKTVILKHNTIILFLLFSNK